MSDDERPTYSVELAKSGQSTCKKCKTKIAKDSLRIGTHSHKNGLELVGWMHSACFSIPRKFKKSTDAETFLIEHVNDTTGTVLPEYKTQLIADIDQKAPAAKAEAAEIPAWYAQLMDQYDCTTDSSRPLKKTKSEHAALLQAYGAIKDFKGPALKTMLEWNLQSKSGTVVFLKMKCVDGMARGRLAHCEACGGRLKHNEQVNGVTCMGVWDEDTQTRIPCEYAAGADACPRWQPWYTSEPTDEQREEMDRLIQTASGEPTADADDADVQQLAKQAIQLDCWDLEDIGKRKELVTKLVEIFEHHPGKSVDLSSNAKEKIYSYLGDQETRTMTQEQIIRNIVNLFGFQQDKKAKAAKKGAALKDAILCAANEPVISALNELAELYFKEKNARGGAAFKKAVKGLSALNFKITPENAMSLSKAKNKVEGVGKSTAEKVLEFLQTGKMEKLEEKRANVA